MRMNTMAALLWMAFLLPGAGFADSLLTPAVAKEGTLVAEKTTRFKVGDIVTVLINEEVDATTSAETRTRKESEIESEAAAADNQFLVGNGLSADLLPNYAIESEVQTRNRGSTLRKTTLETTLSCFVVKVFPNGNLLLDGAKQMRVNREDSMLILQGVVRSRDVTPENTIRSDQMANSVIKLSGRGPLWNNQRRGLVARMLDWFSPN